jgi:hypothetical protein
VRIDVAIAVSLAAAACGCAAVPARHEPADQWLPPDVVGFLERRVLCEHFLGEEPYDADRRRFLERNVRATCAGTDAALGALRKRYRDDPEVVTRLAEFEYPLGY